MCPHVHEFRSRMGFDAQGISWGLVQERGGGIFRCRFDTHGRRGNKGLGRQSLQVQCPRKVQPG